MSQGAVAHPPPPEARPPAPPPAAPASRPRFPRWARDVLEVVVIAVVLYLVIWSLLQTVRVEGSSMVPTLQTQDLLLASKISYHLHAPERGDIVILNPPVERAASQPVQPERDFIKRVLGVPGDVLEIDSTKHPTQLLIKPGGSGSWQRVAEPYLGAPWEQVGACCDSGGRVTGGPCAPTCTPTPLPIPKDMFFVLGDNRNSSSDSRVFGLVQKDRILAKAFFRIWPLDHVGGFGTGPTLVPSLAVVLPLGGRLLSRSARGRRRAPTPRALHLRRRAGSR